VHEDERRTVARLDDPYGSRWVGEMQAVAPDVYATRGKEPALRFLEGHGRTIVHLRGHDWVLSVSGIASPRTRRQRAEGRCNHVALIPDRVAGGR
jgi:hypothetical protein